MGWTTPWRRHCRAAAARRECLVEYHAGKQVLRRAGRHVYTAAPSHRARCLATYRLASTTRQLTVNLVFIRPIVHSFIVHFSFALAYSDIGVNVDKFTPLQ